MMILLCFLFLGGSLKGSELDDVYTLPYPQVTPSDRLLILASYAPTLPSEHAAVGLPLDSSHPGLLLSCRLPVLFLFFVCRVLSIFVIPSL